MKIRNSFVSNSSSTAFIFAFNGQTREELADLLDPSMFNNDKYGKIIIDYIRNSTGGVLDSIYDFVFDDYLLYGRNFVKKLKAYEQYYDRGIESIFELRIGDNEGHIEGGNIGTDARQGLLYFNVNETDNLICWREGR